MKRALAIASIAAAVLLASCGGSGTAPTTAAPGQAPQSSAARADAAPGLPVTVDQGPAIFLFTGNQAVNTLYASVTVCTPGSTTACETIDHVQVDTGSVGLRLLASALSGVAVPQPVADAATGRPLRECVQFADGYSWGSVASADVMLAGRRGASLPVHVIADPAAGTAPASCVSGRLKHSAAALGGNGVLGVGSFVHDCGANCVSRGVSGLYYTCASAGTGALCAPAAVPLDRQVRNPVASLPDGNNGVTLDLPAVASPGSGTASGMMYFGVGTDSWNAAGSATFFTVDRFGTLLTSYNGQSQAAVVDSGSNAYFFTTSAIALCTRHQGFYCPTAGGAPASLALDAAIVGRNGASRTIAFNVDNLDVVFQGQAALPGLAAPSSSFMGGAASVFDWGLPFFYGRRVHVLLDGETVNGVTGPAIGF